MVSGSTSERVVFLAHTPTEGAEREPMGEIDFVDPSLNLLAHAQACEVDLGSQCGGHGVCGRDRVRVIETDAQLSPPSESERRHLSRTELESGVRLACQTWPDSRRRVLSVIALARRASLSLVAAVALCLAAPLGFAGDDPLASHAVMRMGPYRGQAADLSLKQPPILLSDRAGVIRLGNFHHADRYWIAEIPIAQIERAWLQMIGFRGTLGPLPIQIRADHLQLRFDFSAEAPIRLYAQTRATMDHPETATPLESVRGMVVSLNHVSPKDVPYKLFKSIDAKLIAGFYPSQAAYHYVIRAMSVEEQAIQQVIIESLTTPYPRESDQILLAVSRRSREAIARALLLAEPRHEAGLVALSEYGLVHDSCVSEALDAIRLGLGLDRGRYSALRYGRNIRRAAYAEALLTLRAVGLLGPGEEPAIVDQRQELGPTEMARLTAIGQARIAAQAEVCRGNPALTGNASQPSGSTPR